MDMRLQQLVQYIQQQLKSGRSEAVIRNELEQRGWATATIEDAFQQIWQLSQAPAQGSGGAALPAPAYDQAAPRKSRKGLKIALAVIIGVPLLMGILVFAIAMAGQSSLKKNAAETEKKNDAATQQANQNNDQNQSTSSDDESRQADANVIVGAVRNYFNKNDTGYPQSVGKGQQDGFLQLCTATCDPNLSVSVALSFYEPAKVSLKTFSSGLSKPSQSEVFVVTSAVCNKEENWIAQPTDQSQSRVAAILYNRSDTGITCLNL